MPQRFDADELMSRIDNDWDFLADTVQMLDSDGRELLARVKRAVDAKDPAEVGRAGHTIKGMISNFCAPSAQSLALEVEKVGKSGDLSGAPDAIAALEAEFDALLAELKAFVATRP